MLVLGIILLVLGLIFGINILFWIGIILAVLGAVLLFVRPGGRYYY
jgi:hypothetical protein